MLLNNIQLLINGLPDSKNKNVILTKLDLLKKDIEKLRKKYEKSNEDKLTLAHLLSKVNDELEDSLNNEKRFIASVSHELRTPLTAILGYSELLSDTALNNKQKRYLDNIVQSSNHLLSLISDLLDVAKLEDSRIELSPREVDFDDILNECANLIRSRIKEGVEFIVDIPLLEYSIIADDKRVKQIFINLLSNAAKFTEKGSIRFYVKDLQELPNNKLKIVVNVDDTGSGIPKEVASTLFDPFSSTDKTQGTGLGLFISQQLSALMDGKITVETREGVGSSFSVTIVVERSARKEIGKELRGANIMMFAPKDDFVDRIAREFVNLSVNFQNHDVNQENITSSLVQMVVSGRFYDIAVFDLDIFKNYTNYIAGTFKAVNKDIKLVALAGADSDRNLSEFDFILNKPMPYQKFIKDIEHIYSQEFFGAEEEKSYSDLDVLIVEDVELNREYEKEMLDNFFSISCDTAVNGKEAVEKVKEKEYDIILMDMRMPVMDGLEATRKIREFDKKTPIICMSANVYKEDKIAAEEAGMNDFIEKPLEKGDIESKFLKLLNNEFVVKEKKEEKKVEKVEEIDISEIGDKMRETAIGHLRNNFSEEISMKLLGKATASIKEYLNRINKNFSDKNSKALVEDFHALKGVLSNIGLKDLATKAGELQKLSEQDNLIEISTKKDELLKYIKLFLSKTDG